MMRIIGLGLIAVISRVIEVANADLRMVGVAEWCIIHDYLVTEGTEGTRL